MIFNNLLNNYYNNFITIRIAKDNLLHFFYDDNIAFSIDSTAPKTVIHALSCDFNKNYYLEHEILEIKKTRKERKLLYSFTTHHHLDHSGGNKELKELSPETIFISFENMNDNNMTVNNMNDNNMTVNNMNDNNIINISLSTFDIKLISTPCHTLDSVCYIISNKKTNKKFIATGDFIFKLGCGKFFEGSAKLFIESLIKLLKEAEDESIMLYGHDYYETNKRFTEQFYLVKDCDDFLITLKKEKEYNPFFNPEKTVKNKENFNIEERIDELRRLKNNFI